MDPTVVEMDYSEEIEEFNRLLSCVDELEDECQILKEKFDDFIQKNHPTETLRMMFGYFLPIYALKITELTNAESLAAEAENKIPLENRIERPQQDKNQRLSIRRSLWADFAFEVPKTES
jgi:hypothetical protein